jgi:adenylylsulfate kinase-like enzyme
MPELESPYRSSQPLRLPTDLSGSARYESRPVPLVAPAAEEPGLCLWLTASRPEMLRGVAEALSGRLGPDPSGVEVLGIDSLVSKGALSEGANRSAIVATLARAAAALVRRGVTVIIAHPLAPAERASVRDLVGRMVEIYVRTSPKEMPPSHIPVFYRTLENGEVRERELTPHLEPPGRPDVILEGSARGPRETALDIVDALARAGWLDLASRTPGAPTTPLP